MPAQIDEVEVKLMSLISTQDNLINPFAPEPPVVEPKKLEQ